MASGRDWIRRSLDAWVRFVLRFRRSWVLAGLAFGGLSVIYAAGKLGINTDTADMISSALPWRQDFIEYREHFPVRNRNIVVVIDAPSAQQADDFAAALADGLGAETGLFETVFLAGHGDFFERNGLLFLPLDELEALADRLASAQPLLGLLRDDFSGAGVIAMAAETVAGRVERPQVDGEALEPLYRELTRTLAAAAAARREPMAWQTLLSGEAGGAARRLVLLQPALDFSRVQPAGPAIARTRELIAELQATAGPGLTARLTGTVAMEHEELTSVSQSASRAGLAALLLVAAVLYWAFRSMRLVLISVLSLLVGLAGTAAFAAAAVGHLNLLSVAFAVLYVGLGVDFILHLGLRLRELVAGGHPVDRAVAESVGGVGASLVICAVTTAAGFYAFIPTPFEGVSELGLISGTGMFISLLVSLSLLPAMFATFCSEKVLARTKPVAGRIAVKVFSKPMRILWIAAVFMVLTVSALPLVRFDGNPIHLRDPDSESVRAIEDLASASEAPLLDMVALADDHRKALDWAGRLEALPEVRAVTTLDSLVPDQQPDKLSVLEDIDLILGPGFAELERAADDAGALRDGLERLAAELDRLPNPSTAARELRRATAAVLDRMAGASTAETERLAADLGGDLTADLPRQLERLSTSLQAAAFGRDDLPAALSDRWLDDSGRELIEIRPAENVNENAAAERFVTAVRRVVPGATGLPVVHHEASATVVRSFQLALSYALLMVFALLLAFLRRLGDTLLVIAPILFAASATAGLTVWLDLPFNFANIIALPLLVGVGVDNGIHMVHRMRTEPPRDGEPLHTSTSRAVLASGLTTIASFGNLAFSSHIGMASMGKLLTLGMAVTLVATMLVLPAMLKLRAGT